MIINNYQISKILIINKKNDKKIMLPIKFQKVVSIYNNLYL